MLYKVISVDNVLILCFLFFNLEGAGGYTADGKASDYSDFMKWLQCYSKDGMKNMVDHNDRTIWFSGPPGPMVPKGNFSL